MTLDCRCDAAFNLAAKEGCISVVIKEKGTRNYFLREKANIYCFSSDQAEYLALGRLILRVLHLQEFNIIPKGIVIDLYSDNMFVVNAIKSGREVLRLDKSIIYDILTQYKLLMSINPKSNLQWIKRTKNKEAHRYLYNKRHLKRRLTEIIPDQLKFYCV